MIKNALWLVKIASLLSLSLCGCSTTSSVPQPSGNIPPKVYYRYASVLGKKIFYRESGDASKPTIVLLHGYPSSSHTYRELIPLLASEYHVIAPDYLGSGYSDRPSASSYSYTFDKLADHVEALLEQLGVQRFVLYMQDFGAPVGFRLMLRHPERIAGLVSQNANAYLDGLTEKRRQFFLKANRDRSAQSVGALYKWVDEASIIHGQYLRDVPVAKHGEINPDAWTHDLSFLRTQQDKAIQVQLFQDYQNNIDQYPRWQALLRKEQFPALIVWGKNDAAFIPAGAEAYLRDLPKAKLVLLDAGHFAVEENPGEVGRHVRAFLGTL